MIHAETSPGTALLPEADPHPGVVGPGPALDPRLIGTVLKWIHIYFFLLIFESVMRKWVFSGIPMVSMVLLIIRDPVAILIYYHAWKAQLFPRDRLFAAWAAFSCIFCALGLLQLWFLPWMNIWVIVYGVRTYCLHMPLIFVMAGVLCRDDLFRIGRWVLWIAGPMALLMIAQFLSPRDSILNRGMFEGGIGQIDSALGRIRPAGTFSFNTGLTSFNLLAAAFVLYSFTNLSWCNRATKWVAAVAIVCTIPLSGSRAYVLSLVLLFATAFVGSTFSLRLLRVSFLSLVAGALIFLLLSFTSFFQQGMAAFFERWDLALGASGSLNESIVLRFFGEFTGAFQLLGTAPPLGYGIGVGSNVGTALTVGAIGFLLAESEWERCVLEMGPLVAVLWLGARCIFGVAVIARAWNCLRRGQALAWLLFGAECTALFNGSLAQPTSLGFIVFTTGLCLAAAR